MESKIYDMFQSARTVDELRKVGQFIIDSGLSPDEYRKKPEALITLMEHGMMIGIEWTTAITNIGIVDDNIVCKGDTLLRLVRESGELESFEVIYNGSGKDMECTIHVKRKGNPETYFEYSVAEAIRADVYDDYWWDRYPQRMTYYKALGFALRTLFSDVTKGMYVMEEMHMDKAEKRDPAVKDQEIASNTLKHLL